MKLPRVQMMITSVKIILIGRTHTLWDNAGNNIKSRILRIVDKIWQQAKVGPEEMAEAATMEEMDVKKELTSKLEDPFKPSLSTRRKIQQSIHWSSSSCLCIWRLVCWSEVNWLAVIQLGWSCSDPGLLPDYGLCEQSATSSSSWGHRGSKSNSCWAPSSVHRNWGYNTHGNWWWSCGTSNTDEDEDEYMIQNAKRQAYKLKHLVTKRRRRKDISILPSQ